MWRGSDQRETRAEPKSVPQMGESIRSLAEIASHQEPFSKHRAICRLNYSLHPGTSRRGDFGGGELPHEDEKIRRRLDHEA